MSGRPQLETWAAIGAVGPDRDGAATPPGPGLEEAPDLLRSALPWQLRPHFLFNALHSIGVLTQAAERERALRLVTALGDMLQRSLQTCGRDVPLAEETAFLARYVDFEQARLGVSLVPGVELADEVEDAMVPGFLLQPIVEDLARQASEAGATERALVVRALVVRARALDASLEIEARTSASGDERGDAMPGIRYPGTEDLRARLESRYGPAYRLALVTDGSGAGIARLRIPHRTDREPPPGRENSPSLAPTGC